MRKNIAGNIFFYVASQYAQHQTIVKRKRVLAVRYEI